MLEDYRPKHSVEPLDSSSMAQQIIRRRSQPRKLKESKLYEKASTTTQNNGTTARDILAVTEGNAITKMAEFRLKWALKKIMRKLHGLAVPRHNYNRGMAEEWEKEASEAQTQEVQESRWLLRNTDWLNRLLQPIITLTYLLVFWYVSVYLVFRIPSTNQCFLVLWLVVLLIDITLNLNTVKLIDGRFLKTRRELLIEYLKKESVIDVLMVIFIIVDGFNHETALDITIHLLLLAAFVIRISRKSEILRAQFAYKKYVSMIDSIFLLFAFAHFSALLLFMASKFVPEKSWLQNIGIQHASWSSQYIYSLYWAVSTIVTVGYGDITPQNEYEIAVTILIELSGSALYGYLINVIGMTMSELKKEKENLQQQLGIVDRLVKCLSLKDELSYELTSFLKNNRKADTYFSLTDEKRIWDKLKPDLRKRILQETNIRVIKKCLFFLTHFSRNFQDEIALKLVKRIVQPHERLGFDATNQRLCIIDQGKAELQLARFHYNKAIYKTLRVINQNSNKSNFSVSPNLFGFTALLLRRNVNLTAVFPDFAVVYELQQRDFDQMIAEEPFDFETVCELRDRIFNTPVPESYEGPQLLNPLLHYVPIKHLVIRKSTKKISQKRRLKIRIQQRTSAQRFGMLGEQTNEADKTGAEGEVVFERKVTRKFTTIGGTGSVRSLQELEGISLNATETKEVCGFEQAKCYSKYFANFSIDKVLKRYNPIQEIKTRFFANGKKTRSSTVK